MNNAQQQFEELMDQFDRISSDPLEQSRLWKAETGGKVVGCVGLHVPEEIITAAGMLPVVLLEKKGPVIEANTHVQNFMCGYIRSIADQAVTGEFSYLDAMVILDSCHVIRMVGDSLRHFCEQIPPVECLFFPVALHSSLARDYLREELNGFVKRVEKLSGKVISEADLADSIRIHNRNRQLLQRLYALRRNHPGLVSAVQVAHIVQASMAMPKEKHSELLAELLPLLEERETRGGTDRVPVIVSGSLCETCDDVLDIIETSGGVVVDDDLFVGSRYFKNPVDETKPPLEAIASAYCDRTVPCPTVTDPRLKLGKYLHGMAQEANASGVVTVIVKYCEPHYFAYLDLRRRLTALGIRECMIETELDMSASSGQTKTRLQGFLEELAGEYA